MNLMHTTKRWGFRRRQQAAPEIGAELSDEVMEVAEHHGTGSGRVRHEELLATGDEAPANVEIEALGRAGCAGLEADEASQTQEPRVREATADERGKAAAKRHVYAQGRLADLLENARPEAHQAVAKAEEAYEQAVASVGAMGPVRGALGAFGALWRVELAALLAALLDAIAMGLPLKAAGLGAIEARVLLIAVIAGGIWAAVNAVGLLGGALILALAPAQRLRAVLLALGSLIGTLVLGFLLVALLRHQWTGATNQMLAAAAAGQGEAAPRLLDAAFLPALQLAAAAGGAVLIAAYVCGQQRRDLEAQVVQTARLLREARERLAAVEMKVDQARGDVEAADVAINQVYADRDAARVETEVVRERGPALRAAQQARAEAAVARQEWSFHYFRQLYENGGVFLMQMPSRLWATDRGTTLRERSPRD